MNRFQKVLVASFLFTIVGVISCKENDKTSSDSKNEASRLIDEMITELGGKEAYEQLEDVSFSLIYRDTAKNVQDVSIEKFIYDGELSYAVYNEHTKNVFPASENPVTQAWNGKEAWVIVDGNFIPAPPAIRMVKFARNTSFFWFNMMYKMADEGTNHKLLSNRTFDNIEYKIIEVTYAENIGDAQDRFILYMNPETSLIDHFIFSNMFFGPAVPPRMMHVSYEIHNGLKFPKKMAYEMADWEGNLKPGPMRSEKLFSNIQFNTGLEKTLFDKPILTNIPMADLRNEKLKDGIDEEEKAKGKELLTLLEEASGGSKNWDSKSKGTFTMKADWYDNETNWTINPQEFKMTADLGSTNGSITLLNGPQKDDTWNIKNGATYLLDANGQEKEEPNEMILHKNNYKTYWFQLPFRLREAPILAYAGERNIGGENHDILYATWHSDSPNSKYDQFMLYLDKETHLINCLEFTLRDRHPMASGISTYKNFKTIDGITLATSQYITMGTLDQPAIKLHENHMIDFSFE